ncbi:hypothetical protein GF336_07150 [Candidatus Woesearchaeota archaeon]|nr:hypothetical protein [Candidatus Woesearchaeota archaeon]
MLIFGEKHRRKRKEETEDNSLKDGYSFRVGFYKVDVEHRNSVSFLSMVNGSVDDKIVCTSYRKEEVDKLAYALDNAYDDAENFYEHYKGREIDAQRVINDPSLGDYLKSTIECADNIDIETFRKKCDLAQKLYGLFNMNL